MHLPKKLLSVYTKIISKKIHKIKNACRSTGFSVYTAYASYNPVSRRDSELASLSSGRTESDTMSMSSIST